jgi:hypothetical protein
MQRKTVVAVAPSVGRSFALINYHGRNIELLKSRGERQAAVAGTHDDAIRLADEAEFARILLAPTLPALASQMVPRGSTKPAPGTAGLLESLQLRYCCEQSPAFTILQPDDGLAARHHRLEGCSRFDDILILARRRSGLPCIRRGPSEARLEHVTDRFLTLGRKHIPGECEEITPIRIGQEETHGRIHVAARQGARECGECTARGC